METNEVDVMCEGEKGCCVFARLVLVGHGWQDCVLKTGDEVEGKRKERRASSRGLTKTIQAIWEQKEGK